jgi:hypothetical protein
MAEGASEQELAENRTEQTSHVVSKLTAQDVLGLSVDQLKAELLSRGVSVTSRISLSEICKQDYVGYCLPNKIMQSRNRWRAMHPFS